jgi:hypothetical protein
MFETISPWNFMMIRYRRFFAKAWFFIVLLVGPMLSHSMPAIAGESDDSTTIRELEKQQRNLDTIRSYLEGLITASEKNGILVVDQATGLRTAISRERMSLVLGALNQLNDSGIPPSTFGFPDTRRSDSIEETGDGFARQTKLEVEDKVKPLLGDIREKQRKIKEELLRLQNKMRVSHQAAGDLWYLQTPNVNPTKIERHMKDLQEGNLHEVIGIPTAETFSNTDRHTFHGRQGTHDYTCNWVFSEMPRVIEPGSIFEVVVKGNCRANTGNSMGRRMMRIDIKGSGLRMLPGEDNEQGFENFIEVGERYSGKVPTAQKTFRLQAIDQTPVKGGILRLEAFAVGWGPVVTWNWKFGEKPAESGAEPTAAAVAPAPEGAGARSGQKAVDLTEESGGEEE